jgi:hypothetical protein
VANYYSHNVSVLLGIGDGTFGAAVNYGAGTNTRSVAIGDFDGDGKPDLATADVNSGVSVLLGVGDGTFNAAVYYGVGQSPQSIAVGDFNRDGAPDLATANYSDNNVSILLNTASSLTISFNAAVNYGAGTNPYSVAVGDFNGDGIPDLAVANSNSNNVSVLLGKGDGTFNAAVNYGAGTNPYSVAVGDFNRDGKPDLATANYGSNNVSVLLGVGNGTFNAAVNYGAGTGPESVAVGDFNRDGKPDLAVANYLDSNISILLGDGLGAFATAVNYATGVTYADFVAVGDFNGDGKSDLAVANWDNQVSILLGDGLGAFAAAVNYVVWQYPYSVAVDDFDGDGKSDLATANVNNLTAATLRGNGDGTFNASVHYSVGSSPHSVAVGDFNRDGKPDLATANYADDNVSILLNTSAPPPTVTGVNPNAGNQGETLNTVIITGTNFSGATAVNFGAGITVNGFTVDSATQITADITIDGGAALGARDVSVTTPWGTGTQQSGFTVNQSPQSVNTATGTGTATFATNNGSVTDLTALATTPCGTPPANLSFPHGFFSFTITDIPAGSTVIITITLPSSMPTNTQYWKCINGSWVNVTSLLDDNNGDNVLTLTITDGQLGDADGQVNGSISDPGGPGIPRTTVFSSQLPPPKPKPFAESSSAPQMSEQFITSSAKLSVKYLNVRPQQAQANQPVTIFANIANSGDEAGSYTAILKVNGQVEETRTGRIGGRAAVPLKFEVLRDKPGTYNVDINGQSTYFTITDEQSRTDSSKTIPLIGFFLCSIGIIVVSALLLRRMRTRY